MTIKERKQIDKLNGKFTSLHKRLLELKEYKIASEFSTVYYESQSLNYTSGINFIKNLYKL